MRRINTTEDQVNIPVALKLRLYFQMKEKDSQTKSCASRSAQAQTQLFLHAVIACSGLIVTKKLLMSPKRALSSLVSSRPPPGPADSAAKHGVFPP